jgi:hypothetical protein
VALNLIVLQKQKKSSQILVRKKGTFKGTSNKNKTHTEIKGVGSPFVVLLGSHDVVLFA